MQQWLLTPIVVVVASSAIVVVVVVASAAAAAVVVVVVVIAVSAASAVVGAELGPGIPVRGLAGGPLGPLEEARALELPVPDLGPDVDKVVALRVVLALLLAGAPAAADLCMRRCVGTV